MQQQNRSTRIVFHPVWQFLVQNSVIAFRPTGDLNHSPRKYIGMRVGRARQLSYLSWCSRRKLSDLYSYKKSFNLRKLWCNDAMVLSWWLCEWIWRFCGFLFLTLIKLVKVCLWLKYFYTVQLSAYCVLCWCWQKPSFSWNKVDTNFQLWDSMEIDTKL